MSTEAYAEHKGAELIDNPDIERINIMECRKSKAEVEAEANEYIEQLEGKLDDAAQ